ncbi:MAG TPA: nitrilase-related carbon-nitrogen hydrolase [Verrucomicrobiales bacterium]|nr:nitrilase-related carbon-nitrogen hydrolase [Verrucomicrobiales bacterium]
MELIGLQTDIAWLDRTGNHSQVAALLELANPVPGALVVLPEMFASGFSQDVDAATVDVAASEAFLAGLARQYGIALMAGLATRQDGCGANVSVTYGPDGKELARYRKLQPFSMAGEGEAYPAGDRVVTFEWGGFTVAPFICYDLRFPEIFRIAADRGASLFAVVANWPDRRHHHWSTLLRARAIENQAGLIGVNRAGTDPDFHYAGGSAILGPQAEVLSEAGESPGFIKAELHPGTVAEWRAGFPALRDRRKDISSL